MTVWKSLWCATALVALIGCYKYEAASLETVPEGATVRALLSTEGQMSVMERARMELRELDGRLVERRADRLLFDVRATEGSPGERSLYQRIDLAPRDVLRVDVRRVDAVRTALVAAGAAAAVAVVLIAAIDEQNPGQPPPGNGPPPESRVRAIISVPVISW